MQSTLSSTYENRSGNRMKDFEASGLINPIHEYKPQEDVTTGTLSLSSPGAFKIRIDLRPVEKTPSLTSKSLSSDFETFSENDESLIFKEGIKKLTSLKEPAFTQTAASECGVQSTMNHFIA